jgi:hypothetical protein
MEFTFNTLHIQQSAVFAYSTCVRLAHTFGLVRLSFFFDYRLAGQ